MTTEALFTFFTAMFAILNPIGSVAIFTGMTANRSASNRKSVAIRSSVAVAIILVVTVWGGELLLKIFNVGIPSLQVAGGLMIAMISISMLQSNQSPIHDTKEDPTTATTGEDIAVVPLALPMIAGPGAMVTVVVSTHQYHGVTANLEMSVICIILAAIICLGFFAAGPISRKLGVKGMDIITKIMGMILLAIAVGMLADGLKDLLPGLAGINAG